MQNIVKHLINLTEAINEIMIFNDCNKGINPLLHNLLGEPKLRFIRLIKQNYENFIENERYQ